MVESVTVFTKDRCSACYAIKRVLSRRNVNFTEVKDEERLAEVARQYGFRQAPVTVLRGEGGEVITAFAGVAMSIIDRYFKLDPFKLGDV